MPVAPTSRLGALVGSTGLLLALGAGPALAATPTSSASSPASADVELQGEACPEDQGATVLVDPQGLAGGDLPAPTAGCALEAPDGLTALTEAGFTATESSPGFVCTIEGVPAPEQADCLNDGYWSYWYAPRDGEWTSSPVGAAERVPEVGGVEAWSWTELSGDSLEGAPPRVEPAAVATLPVAGGGAPTASPSSTTPTGAAEDGTVGDSPAVDPEGADASEVAADSEEAASVPWTTLVVVGVVAVVVVLALVLGALRAQRRRDEEMDERRSDAR